ncbi:MAG: N-acetylmuramoyl-L-alanine amidase [Cyanophyceae cyanobacterium]
MKQTLGLTVLTSTMIGLGKLVFPVAAQTQELFLAYPPPNHQTTATQIFMIGTAAPDDEVLINGQPIEQSPAGHFAPSFPLQMGVNVFTLRSGGEEIQVEVTRVSSEPELPVGVAFAPDSLTPAQDMARLPGERICFEAIAPPEATVSVSLRDRVVPLLPQSSTVQLPANAAVLTEDNRPQASTVGQYAGCTVMTEPGVENPVFQLSLDGETITQPSPASVEILSPTGLAVVEVTAEAGVARTGPSTNYSRLTPLPQGTRATVTGQEGEWLRLDYGAWIKAEETQVIPNHIPVHSLIRSVNSRQFPGAIEIVFPLQNPVPVSVQQGDHTLTLTLYNTTAQTDTIRLDDDPLIERLDWQQVTPTQIAYTFHLKTEQQWGYDLRYEGTSLLLTLQHPPEPLSSSNTLNAGIAVANAAHPLSGVKILLDPGHGGEELGARGPNGVPEKEVNLVVSKLLQQELEQRGATVYMTRDTDEDVSLKERVDMIDEIQPAIALSIHYNALPDDGDALNTAGIGTFWYHPQAHNLAVFMHNYLVETLDRPSYGVFWNNLALTRPHTAPAVLLELGFMINPVEFEWITNPQQQQQLAEAIAQGVVAWFNQAE